MSRGLAAALGVLLGVTPTIVSASGGGIAAGADVVVVTGLPGDVESEKALGEQLATLLGILAGEGSRPRRVFVLCDAPKAVTLPPGLAAEVGAATREAFLAIASRLDGAAPLLVVAWGHGGMQGETPVFHVRGPRLTAQDFGVLMRRAPAARAILFFRGSGAFARVLAAPGREILASENDVVFRSDPIGLSLLLKALTDDPALDLRALATRLGRATKAWYDGRHLARQEEPTLWFDAAASPRVLVEEAGNAPEAETPAAPQRTQRSEAWKGIEAVEPRRFPDADAVVLSSRMGFTLGEDPAIESEAEQFIQVLTAEGKRYGDFDVAYSPPFETLTFLDCEVLAPDGTLERLDPEQIREAAPPPMAEYTLAARKVFSLPHVGPGAMLRIHTRREWKRFPLPHVSLEIPLAGEAPILKSQVEVRVSRKEAFHFGFRNRAETAPQVGETTYGRVFSWAFDDVRAEADEPLTRPGRTPTLLISTFPDWQAFADWYRGLIQEADRITPEVTAKAAELVRGARTERQKIAAVYDFVTGLRYVAVPLGVNSHRPHAAANVLRNRYGDCKDKANLFNTLLRSLGIEADLVLVPRFSQADAETPGLAFNHAISRVRLGNEILWADTTDDVARFGLLPPGDPGRKVLVVDGRPAALTELPRPEPGDHRMDLTARIEASSDAAGALPGVADLRTTGYADYELRQAARHLGPRGGQPLLAASLRPQAGLFALTRQSSTAVAALGEAFAWHGEGVWHGLVASLPAAGQRLVRAPFWLPREWDAALHQRTAPLYLNQGYPLTLHEQIDIALPAGAAGLAAPPPQASEAAPLRWRVEWTPGAGRIVARLEATLATGDLTWDETLAFQDGLRHLTAALASGATYTQAH